MAALLAVGRERRPIVQGPGKAAHLIIAVVVELPVRQQIGRSITDRQQHNQNEDQMQ